MMRLIHIVRRLLGLGYSSTSQVVWAGGFEDGLAAYEKGDFATALNTFDHLLTRAMRMRSTASACYMPRARASRGPCDSAAVVRASRRAG